MIRSKRQSKISKFKKTPKKISNFRNQNTFDTKKHINFFTSISHRINQNQSLKSDRKKSMSNLKRILSKIKNRQATQNFSIKKKKNFMSDEFQNSILKSEKEFESRYQKSDQTKRTPSMTKQKIKFQEKLTHENPPSFKKKQTMINKSVQTLKSLNLSAVKIKKANQNPLLFISNSVVTFFRNVLTHFYISRDLFSALKQSVFIKSVFSNPSSLKNQKATSIASSKINTERQKKAENQTNRYSKTIYNKNAMILFTLYQNFRNQKFFHMIQSQNMTIIKTFFQQMFEFKKKDVNKAKNSFLNSDSFRYVEQNERYFFNWFNCFREESFMILKKHIFVSKRSSTKMTKKKNKNRQFFQNASAEKTEIVQQNQLMQQNWSSLQQASSVLSYLQFLSDRLVQTKIFRVITIFAVQSTVLTFVTKIQSVSVDQKSTSVTYHFDNNAFESNLQRFDYIKSKSNVKYRFIQNSRKTIRNDRIIFTQNVKRQQNYVKNLQQKYQKFYDDYNHSPATYELQNQSKYNDYYFQSIQFRLFSESRKENVKNQSKYNDYYQQSVQFRLPSRSRKKDVFYSFKKKFEIHHISKKNRRLNTMTNEKRYIFASPNRHSDSYKKNTRFVFRESRRLMTISEIESFKKNFRDVYFSSKSFRFQSAYEINSEAFVNDYASQAFANDYIQQSTWHRSESDVRAEQYVYESSSKLLSEFSSSKLSSSESISYSDQNQSYQTKSVKLKSQKIMKFDFDTDFVVFFIKRFQFITQVKGKAAVLKILFMCLKNAALKWHINLSKIIRIEMQNDLKIWKNELLRKYRSNQFKFMKKTRNLIFIFDESFNLSIYLSRKTNLLYNEKQIDELQMIYHLWNDLKFQLALITSIRQNENTLESFDRRIWINEKIARKVHNQMKAEKIKKKTKKYFRRNKSKYAKTYEKKFWNSDKSTKRIQKLLNKIFFKTEFWIRIKKIKIKTFRKPLNTETENSTKTKKFSSKKKIKPPMQMMRRQSLKRELQIE